MPARRHPPGPTNSPAAAARPTSSSLSPIKRAGRSVIPRRLPRLPRPPSRPEFRTLVVVAQLQAAAATKLELGPRNDQPSEPFLRAPELVAASQQRADQVIGQHETAMADHSVRTVGIAAGGEANEVSLTKREFHGGAGGWPAAIRPPQLSRKISRISRARVVLPEDEGPEIPTRSIESFGDAIGSGMMVKI